TIRNFVRRQGMIGAKEAYDAATQRTSHSRCRARSTAGCEVAPRNFWTNDEAVTVYGRADHFVGARAGNRSPDSAGLTPTARRLGDIRSCGPFSAIGPVSPGSGAATWPRCKSK